MKDKNYILSLFEYNSWANSETYRMVSATPHRVIPPVSVTRYSMPFFMCPNLEAVIDCLPTCYSATNPPNYKPESFWSFHTNHMSKIYPHFAAKEDEL